MKVHELESLSEMYLAQKNIAPSTKRSYRNVYRQFIKYLKDCDISYAKTSDVIKYREHKRMFGHSAHYIYIQISALKGLYRYLKNNQKQLNISEVYLYDVLKPIRNERIKHHIKKPVLNLKQAKHLIMNTKKTRIYIWHYRDHAIIYLMLTAGLRAFEIIHAKKDDYQVVAGKRILYLGENEKETFANYVNIPPGVEEAIDDYLNKRKDHNPHLFTTTKNISPRGYLSQNFFKEMLKRVLKSCGLDGLGITPHCLRHTAGIMNLLRGGTLVSTQSLLRHKGIQSTLVYKDYLDRLNNDSEFQIEKYILKENPNDLYHAVIAYFQVKKP